MPCISLLSPCLYLFLNLSSCVAIDRFLFSSLLFLTFISMSDSPFLCLSSHSALSSPYFSVLVSTFLPLPFLSLGCCSLLLLSAAYFPSLQSHTNSFSLSLGAVTCSSPLWAHPIIAWSPEPSSSGEDHKPDEGRCSVGGSRDWGQELIFPEDQILLSC